MANAVNLPGERLAGLIIDLMQKLKAGVRTLDELALFLQGKNPFSLASYFRTRKGLYVYEPFAERILPFAKESDTADIGRCDYVDQPKDMSDTDIIKTYLSGMVEAKKNASTLAQLRTFLDNQWNGEEGSLLVNGYANIFYCLGEDGNLFAVNAALIGGEWEVDGWGFDENGAWVAGNRIFRNKP